MFESDTFHKRAKRPFYNYRSKCFQKDRNNVRTDLQSALRSKVFPMENMMCYEKKCGISPGMTFLNITQK